MSDLRGLQLDRRSALKLAGAAVVAGGWGANARAAPTQQLRIISRVLDVKGKAAKVFGIVNDQGKPGLDLQFGAPFNVRLRNELAEDTIIHWHGLTPPVNFDGVALGSVTTLKAGDERPYLFDLPKTGTHWMHSHRGLQEQHLLAAPLIVRETSKPLFDEQEHVVIIHDFTFRDPREILEELKNGGGAHAGHAMKGMDMSKTPDMEMDGLKMDGMAMGGMANDVNFDALLANDRTMDDPEVVQAENGGRFRLRIINACAASNLWIDLGNLAGQLIAVDGNAIYPVTASRFPLAVAQRADIRLTLPAGSQAFPILFQSEGAPLRAGIFLKAGDAIVGKLGDTGEAGAAIDLAFESGLKAVGVIPDEPVTRTEMLMLGGGGDDYVWTLNGKSGMHETLFSVRQGERIDLVMHNMTSMSHPMHLHGHYFKVVNINGTEVDGALRDTILVPSDNQVTLRFDANNPGTWPLHCHHLYHMNAGMMGTIAYTSAA
jgi:FtsP/CotA-like multicopper oxidase with cupredoxin domain